MLLLLLFFFFFCSDSTCCGQAWHHRCGSGGHVCQWHPGPRSGAAVLPGLLCNRQTARGAGQTGGAGHRGGLSSGGLRSRRCVVVLTEFYMFFSFFSFFFCCGYHWHWCYNYHHPCCCSCAFLATSPGFTVLGEIFAYVTIFLSNHRGSHILSSWISLLLLLLLFFWCYMHFWPAKQVVQGIMESCRQAGCALVGVLLFLLSSVCYLAFSPSFWF